MERLLDPEIEKLRNDYKVLEDPDLEQVEKESTFQVDKGEKVINFCSRIGSHIRVLINSENENIKIKSALVNENKLHQITAKIPLNSLTVSVKDKPKKSGYVSDLLI